MLENVLVNAVVRKACQRVSNFIHVDFGFHRFRGFCEPQNSFNNASQLTRG